MNQDQHNISLQQLTLDEHGFLKNYADWTPAIAESCARNLTPALQLSEQHFQIIHIMRAFYLEHQHIPTVRILCKIVKLELGETQGNSIYLHTLFPDKLLRKLCYVAGLPKPKHCL